jgi:hypothetical protein
MKKSTIVVAGLVSTFAFMTISTAFAQHSAVNKQPSKTFVEHFGQTDTNAQPKAGAKKPENQ